MSANSHHVRIETLVALALSKRWPRPEPDVVENIETDESVENASDSESDPDFSSDLSRVLAELSASDQNDALDLIHRFERLSPVEQSRWLGSRIGRIRAGSPERDRRFTGDIHPSQIIEALRSEPRLIRSLIVRMLPPLHREAIAAELGVSLAAAPKPGNTKIAEVVHRAFFAQFVPTTVLKDQTALDLLSGVELARLIRLLGVRETAIACKSVAAVEAVTAFLRRFSAEDAHAIRFQLASLKTLEPERINFAETVVRNAIEDGSIDATTLDRVGLVLLAMVLAESDRLCRRHTAQKLPIAAARQLGELVNESLPDCEPETARQIIAETHSLAATLHHEPVQRGEERRIAPLI